LNSAMKTAIVILLLLQIIQGQQWKDEVERKNYKEMELSNYHEIRSSISSEIDKIKDNHHETGDSLIHVNDEIDERNVENVFRYNENRKKHRSEETLRELQVGGMVASFIIPFLLMISSNIFLEIVFTPLPTMYPTPLPTKSSKPSIKPTGSLGPTRSQKPTMKPSLSMSPSKYSISLPSDMPTPKPTNLRGNFRDVLLDILSLFSGFLEAFIFDEDGYTPYDIEVIEVITRGDN